MWPLLHPLHPSPSLLTSTSEPEFWFSPSQVPVLLLMPGQPSGDPDTQTFLCRTEPLAFQDVAQTPPALSTLSRPPPSSPSSPPSCLPAPSHGLIVAFFMHFPLFAWSLSYSRDHHVAFIITCLCRAGYTAGT